ncbi:MAG: hypothetical protein NVV66_18660 [Cellulomonas sp.]|uniref:hypothetical protein n=1 Tax=Cellulomonas sp. TaxID=40001 RepID=UPI002586A8EE|nr:hypothetical protein [Cellulomonas sp.]MCR6706618.1 hypothetical protein [Cellulomonas sp.]
MAAQSLTYGRTADEWETLVSETTTFLEERARLGRTTTYTELNAVLARRTGLREFRFEDASERAAMGHLLGQVVERDFPTRGYMLSALVIYLGGNDAGSGFYVLATQMGLFEPGGDKLAFWTGQLKGLSGHGAS